MLFVGLDVIGDYLTEINVTSPTCVRELDAQFGLNIAGSLFDAIERRLAAKMSRSVSPSDRLTGTVILSFIGYAVLVLGVGFTLNRAAPVSPTLDVILSPTSSANAPKQADFLAQADNQGGGDSQQAQRPTDDQISQLPQTDPGDAPIPLQAQKTAPEPDAVQRTVITRADSNQNVARAREQKPNTPDALPEGDELIERSLELAKLGK